MLVVLFHYGMNVWLALCCCVSQYSGKSIVGMCEDGKEMEGTGHSIYLPRNFTNKMVSEIAAC